MTTRPATMLIADPATVREQLFVLAHDEERGFRLLLNPDALSIGLAGAALMDLLIANRAYVSNGRIFPLAVPAPAPPLDPVTADILETVRQVNAPRLQSTPLLPVLLRNLDRDLYPRTAAALTAAGVLATRHRRLRRHQTLLLHHSVAVRTRAKARYRALGQEMEGSDADALCALVSALGLHDVLMFADARRRVQTLLDPFVTPIPGLSGALYPLAGIPFVAEAVKRAVGDLATATPL